MGCVFLRRLASAFDAFGIDHGFAGLCGKRVPYFIHEVIGLKPPHFEHPFGIPCLVDGMHGFLPFSSSGIIYILILQGKWLKL